MYARYHTVEFAGILGDGKLCLQFVSLLQMDHLGIASTSTPPSLVCIQIEGSHRVRHTYTHRVVNLYTAHMMYVSLLA